MITPAKTVWLMGLPCSGKTTLGDSLALFWQPWRVVRLDGDVVRDGISAGQGFSPDGRTENIRRSACIAELLNQQGFYVVCSFVTPCRYHRQLIASIVSRVDFVHVSTPATVCQQRDTKGLWAAARAGRVSGFTGYDSDFEAVAVNHLDLDGSQPQPDCLQQLLDFVEGAAD